MPEEEIEELYNVTVKDWAARKKDIKGWELMFTYLGQIADVGNKIEDLAMGELINFYGEHLKQGKKLHEIGGTITGGLAGVTKPLQDYFENQGGEIRLSCPANDILIENGKIIGVEVETGKRLFPTHVLDTDAITAPIVISTLPVWDLFKVIPNYEFPAWFRDWIDRLQRKICHVWTIVCAVDEPLWDIKKFKWCPKLPHTGTYGVFFQHQSYGDEAGEVQVNLCIQGNYDDLPDLSDWQWADTRRRVRQVLDNLEKDGREMIPGLEKATKWQISNAAVFGLSESPGIAGRHRPPIVPPGIENLYLLSDTINEAHGLGIQAIAKASQALLNKIISKD